MGELNVLGFKRGREMNGKTYVAATREAKAVEARYRYIRAIFLHPNVRGDLASHLLIDHPTKPVGHRNAQKKVGADSIGR